MCNEWTLSISNQTNYDISRVCCNWILKKIVSWINSAYLDKNSCFNPIKNKSFFFFLVCELVQHEYETIVNNSLDLFCVTNNANDICLFFANTKPFVNKRKKILTSTILTVIDFAGFAHNQATLNNKTSSRRLFSKTTEAENLFFLRFILSIGMINKDDIKRNESSSAMS